MRQTDNINISATQEQALATALWEKQRTDWLADNKAAIEAYNHHVEKHGAFSDGLRVF
jgi:antitoxin CcdA